MRCAPSLAEAEARVLDLRQRRTTLDAGASEHMKRIVRSVMADRDEGEDGELYAAMGFIRRSDRSSGLTRRRIKTPEKPEGLLHDVNAKRALRRGHDVGLAGPRGLTGRRLMRWRVGVGVSRSKVDTLARVGVTLNRGSRSGTAEDRILLSLEFS